MKTEPSLIVSIVAALLTLTAAFGFPVTDVQREAILQFMLVVGPVIIGGGVIIRQVVWSKASVERIVEGQADPKILP